MAFFHESGSPEASSREPIFNLPAVIVWMIVAMLCVQLVMVFGSDDWATIVLLDWSFIPARLAMSLGLNPSEALQVANGGPLGGEDALIMQFLTKENMARPWTLLTYAALHGSWGHLFLNSIWLAAFGAPLARRLGTERFLMVFGLSVGGGAALHFALNWYDVMPLIGASGGIAGIIASTALFMFQPGSALGRPAADENQVPHPPALRLSQVWQDRRVMWFVGLWLGINLVTGLVSLAPADGVLIAWEAHLGGFITGFFAFRSFDPWS